MYSSDIERKSPQEIKIYQENRLQELLKYLNSYSPFYSELFKKHQINIAEIRSLEDLQKIPTTSKDDLQKRNMDFLCVPRKKILDYITTSGTLGDPVVFAMTNKDLKRLAYNEYRSFVCTGGTEDDIYQLMVTLDRRFMAGLAYFLGLKKLGAGIVRVGPGNPELQFDTIDRIKPTALVAVPSFLLKLIEYAEEKNIDVNKTSVKSVICIGEPIRTPDLELNKLGEQITKNWNIKLYSTYASTEMGAAFTECLEAKGGHHQPELLIVEFLDDSNKPVGPGELGEITVSTLGVEGMPLLRFKTGDICYHYSDPCECGRNTLRLSPLIGRKKHMIKFKGTTLYPPSLYEILNELKSIINYVIEVSTNEIGTDDLKIIIGCETPTKDFEKSIKDHFRAKLRVAPKIEFQDPQKIERLKFPEMSRKPILFFDNRDKKVNDM